MFPIPTSTTPGSGTSASDSGTGASIHKFLRAETLVEALAAFRNLGNETEDPSFAATGPTLNDGKATGDEAFPYRRMLKCVRDVRATELCKLLDEKANAPVYTEGPRQAVRDRTVFVVGMGPGGLRAAIEARLVGHERVVLLDKRRRFARNNVLHLWKFAIQDYLALGAKIFFPKFCTGNYDHISIRRLQLVLLKVALLLGVEAYVGVEFLGYKYDMGGKRWAAQTAPALAEVPDKDCIRPTCAAMDALIGADGENSKVATMAKFERKVFKARQALGITANFVNDKTREESSFEQFSMTSYLNQQRFAELAEMFNIKLETMTYFKDETHYFVITAIGKNLLERGILKEDKKDTTELVDRSNVDHDKLVEYIEQFAEFVGLPKPRKLCLTVYGRGDVHVFDFTKKLKASTMVRLVTPDSGQESDSLPVFLCGDALLEPFWPQGTGAARSSLSAQDAIFALRRYMDEVQGGRMTVQEFHTFVNVLFQQMSHSPNSLKTLTGTNPAYTLDPLTRYEATPQSLI